MPCHSHAEQLGANRNSDWYSLMLHVFSLWPWKVVVVIQESEDRLPRLKKLMIVFSSSSKLWNNTVLFYFMLSAQKYDVSLVYSRKRHLIAVVGRHAADAIWKIRISCGLVKACCWIISQTGLLQLLLFFVVLCEVFVAEVRILGTFNLLVVNSGVYAIPSLFWCQQCLISYFL
jgi:hypothetical protein